MSVGVVVPTITGREEYLARALIAYEEHTPGVEVRFYVIENRPTCGIAWQEGAEAAQADGCHYLHLTADDIVPAPGWFEPFRAKVEAGTVPCGLVVIPLPETLDENALPIPGAPIARAHFFEAEGDEGFFADGYPAISESEYPAIPFCSMEQWTRIGPMVASHYGTDKWFGLRARAAGIQPVACHGAHFYHYAANAGRAQGDWLHWDRLDFDFNIAWPAYVGGELPPTQRHPLDATPEGRAAARAWRVAHIPAPYPWDDPDLDERYRS